MTEQPSIVRDLFDIRIFKYWIFALAIALVVLGGFIAAGIFSFSFFVDPLSIMGSEFVSDDVGVVSAGVIQSVIAFFFGTIITAVVGALSWFSFGLILLAVVSLFNESIIKIIRNKHYPQVPLISGFSMWPMFVEQAKVIVVYTSALIVALLASVIFIFFLGWLSMPLFLLWSFLLYRSLLLLDCGLTIFPRERIAKERRMTVLRYWPVTVITYTLTLIPWVNLFSPLIAIVWTSHIMLAQKMDEMIEDAQIQQQ